MYDMDIYATDAITEQMPGSGTADDLRRAVENIENDFYLDSYAPYHSQEIELINDFERDFGADAEDLCDSGQTFKASEFGIARRAYAAAIGWLAFESALAAAKETVTAGIDVFSEMLENSGVEDAVIQVSRSDAFGWAACTRIIGDEGEIYAFEAGQLDGSNGFSMRVVPGLWLSCAFDAKAAATDGGK
jgi:hypothetical protein